MIPSWDPAIVQAMQRHGDSRHSPRKGAVPNPATDAVPPREQPKIVQGANVPSAPKTPSDETWD